MAATHLSLQESSSLSSRIDGHCDQRFASVREVFADNFARGEEVGASCCVVLGSVKVVDLWGGVTAPGASAPWERDTIVNMMSVAKGVSALVVHIAADRGLLDLDSPVARYWPEFTGGGKEAVLVAHVLDHTAGLEVLDDPLWPGAAYDWNAMTGALERQAVRSLPGTTPGYHTVTMSFLIGELIRRVTGKSYGRVLQDWVCGPLGLDYHVGLSLPHHARCARFVKWAGYNQSGHGSDGPPPLLVQAWAQFDPERDDDWNSEQFRLAEIPGVNGHGNARSIATLYGVLSQGGGQLVSADALRRATALRWFALEPVLTHHYRMGLGFTLNSPDAYMGPSQAAFGHVGAGGSTGYADPEAGYGFAYAMNLMRTNRDNGPRARRLIEALHSCL